MKWLLVILVVLLAGAVAFSGCSKSQTPTSTAAITTPTSTTTTSTSISTTTTTSRPVTTTAATTPATTTTQTSQTTTTAPSTTTTITTSKPPTTTTTTTTSTGGQKRGGTLTWIMPNGPPGPIGYLPEVTGPSGVTPQIAFQTLLKEMLDGSMKPGLAASYEVNTSADDPSITFRLQRGIKFHDGTDFNAQAVKWNLDLIKATPYYLSTASNWKSIDVVDDYSVRIRFVGWQNGVIRVFGDTMAYMASPTAFAKNGIDWMRYNMVGTGPFVQETYQRDITLVGARNPNYWEAGKPYLDKMRYVFVADDLTAIALYKSGGGDVVQSSNPTMLKELSAQGNNVISVFLGPTSLVPDGANADSPWGNVKIRQAAEYAIDKEAMANTFGYGFKAAYQFSTPMSKAFDSTIAGRKYDVAKAKQLMAEGGYPQGFKTQILASPIFLNRDAVLAVQSYLSKIGIQTELVFPGSAQWSDLSTKPYKNALIYTSINEWGNQNTTFNYFLGDPATVYKSAYKPDGWKALLDSSKATPEPDPTMLKKMENIIYDTAMAIPMYYGANNFVFKPDVMDHGEGTRGQSNWHEPQNTWLNR